MSNNGHGSIRRRRRLRVGITCSSIGRRRSHEQISIFYIVRVFCLITYHLLLPNWPISIAPSDAKSNFKEIRLKKKTENRNMKSHKKLIFIEEYCAYIDEYRPNNKKKFWFII